MRSAPLLAGMLFAALLAAACVNPSSGCCGGVAGASRAARRPSTRPPARPGEAGQPEGQLTVLDLAGYAENGSNDPNVNWGVGGALSSSRPACKVNVHTFVTS